MYSKPFNKRYETDGINNNNFIYHYIYLAIIIIINFAEDFNRSFLGLRLDLKSPELELELELKSLELELELELKLIVSSGIGIGIENNGIGIGIELKKWNWPQPWTKHYLCCHGLWNRNISDSWAGMIYSFDVKQRLHKAGYRGMMWWHWRFMFIWVAYKSMGRLQ